MRNGLILLSLASLGGGCAGPQGGLFGIWAITMAPYDDADPTTVITHNYVGAVTNDDTGPIGPWTYTNTADQSPSIVMAEIFGLTGKGEDGAVMVIAGEVFPGHETEEKGTWEFIWDSFADDRDGMQHTDGYTFTADSSTHVMSTVTIVVDGSSATGSVDVESNTQIDYLESERWDPTDNFIMSSQIPSNFYLFDAVGSGLSNADATDECTSDPCALGIQFASTGHTTFTAAWTRYKDAGAFDGIEGAGQPFGTGFDPYYYYYY